MSNIESIILQELEIQKTQPVDAKHKKDKKSDLILYILGNTLHKEVKRHLDAATGAKDPDGKAQLGATGGNKKTQFGAAAPPWPPVPDSGAPGPSIPTQDGAFSASNFFDKLVQMIAYLKEHPNDPKALQNFMTYLIELNDHPSLMTADVKSLLNDASITKLLFGAMQQQIVIAFFMGYGGLTGPAAAQKFMQDMAGFLNGLPKASSNPYIQSMLNGLNGFNLAGFTLAHDQAGDLGWDINGVWWSWTNGGKDTQKFLEKYFFNLGENGKVPNPYYDKLKLNILEHDYRVKRLKELLLEFKNPEIAIMLWMMSAYDNQFQGQESGLASTTNLLSDMTNNVATKLSGLLAALGPNFTPKQAMDFAKTLFQGTGQIDAEGQLESIAKNWNSGTFKAICDIHVKYEWPPNSGSWHTNTLGSMMKLTLNGQLKGGSAELAAAFQSLVPATPKPGSTDPTTSPGYQALLTAVQQGGTLITGTSKTVSTQLATVADTDNAVVKMGNSMVDPNGGGLVQLESSIVKNQISH